MLSAAEVNILFVTTVTASLSDGLQLGYRFDSVSGSRVGNMASGSVVYDATLMNGAVVSHNIAVQQLFAPRHVINNLLNHCRNSK